MRLVKPDPSHSFRRELGGIVASLVCVHDLLRQASGLQPADAGRQQRPNGGAGCGITEAAAREMLRVLATCFVGPASLIAQALLQAVTGPDEGVLGTLEAIYRNVGEALRKAERARDPGSGEKGFLL